MSPDSCYLITLLDRKCNGLIHVALKAEEYIVFCGEPEGKERLAAMLPPHIRSIGKIVDVKDIFDVVDVTAKK